MSGHYFIGRWDCSQCGSKGIMGDQLICPNCGKPRASDVEFYLPERSPEITDVKGIQEAKAGPDWYCQHCGAANAADREICKQCGAPKGSSPSHAVGDFVPDTAIPRRSQDIHNTRDFGGTLPERYHHVSDEDETQHSETIEEQRQGVKLPSIPHTPILVAVGILLAVVIAFMLFHTTEKDLVVTGFSWSRSIDIEAYRTVTEGDWSVPSGGRIVSTETRIRSYNHRLDHYQTKTRTVSVSVPKTETYSCTKNLGNGRFQTTTCTRTTFTTQFHTETYQDPVYVDDPIYATWYNYDIEKWVFDRTEKSAANDHRPVWPSHILATNERDAQRNESYTLHLLDSSNNKIYDYNTDVALWQSCQLQDHLKGEVNAFGILLKVTR